MNRNFKSIVDIFVHPFTIVCAIAMLVNDMLRQQAVIYMILISNFNFDGFIIICLIDSIDIIERMSKHIDNGITVNTKLTERIQFVNNIACHFVNEKLSS